MKREEFLQQLKLELSHLPPSEREEIIRDQDEYIRDAVSAGRNEEQVVHSLGSAKQFAASLNVESKIERAEKSSGLKSQVSTTLSALVAVLALAPLNLIFALGPFIAIFAIVMGGWAMAGAMLLTSILFMCAFVFKFVFIAAGLWAHLASFFFILGCIGVSVLGMIFMYRISQLVLKMVISYLKWNLNFIKGRA